MFLASWNTAKRTRSSMDVTSQKSPDIPKTFLQANLPLHAKSQICITVCLFNVSISAQSSSTLRPLHTTRHCRSVVILATDNVSTPDTRPNIVGRQWRVVCRGPKSPCWAGLAHLCRTSTLLSRSCLSLINNAELVTICCASWWWQCVAYHGIPPPLRPFSCVLYYWFSRCRYISGAHLICIIVPTWLVSASSCLASSRTKGFDSLLVSACLDQILNVLLPSRLDSCILRNAHSLVYFKWGSTAHTHRKWLQLRLEVTE